MPAAEGSTMEPAAEVPVEPVGEPIKELPLDVAVALATALHRSGDREEAETLYRRVIEVDPDHASALHFLGILTHQDGREDEAIALLRRSIELRPNEFGFRLNVGNVFLQEGRAAEAAECYEAAIGLDGASGAAYNNLGVALRALGRFEEAEARYRQAIALDPADREALNNLGRLLRGVGRAIEAVECHARALTLAPRDRVSRQHLIAAYQLLGEVEEARAVLRDWLSDDPNDPVALHLYAAASGEKPERASDSFVEATFDRFAEQFDANLEALEYRAPWLVADALARALAGRTAAACLDAGCGTGLCGPLLAPHAGRLVGVDLSALMLERARPRGVYAELVKAELTSFLEEHPDAFDAIVSADTLVYFGSLDRVLRAAGGALRPDGTLVFTVEHLVDNDPAGFRLELHGRYSHSRDYLLGALAGAALKPLSIDSAVLRMEAFRPVKGLVVTATRAGGPDDHGRANP
jgi:predicted TPR repeat methyltransferase